MGSTHVMLKAKRGLEFAFANDLVVRNTCFIKRESHLVTFNSGTNRTQIDYILYRRGFHKAVKDVKVIAYEKCVQQHNLVVCDFSVLIPRPKKRKFTTSIRSWKLQVQAVENEIKGVFTEKVTATQFNSPAETNENIWAGLKNTLLEAGIEVCGLSKSHQWKKKTWWWDVGVVDT